MADFNLSPRAATPQSPLGVGDIVSTVAAARQLMRQRSLLSRAPAAASTSDGQQQQQSFSESSPPTESSSVILAQQPVASDQASSVALDSSLSVSSSSPTASASASVVSASGEASPSPAASSSSSSSNVAVNLAASSSSPALMPTPSLSPPQVSLVTFASSSPHSSLSSASSLAHVGYFDESSRASSDAAAAALLSQQHASFESQLAMAEIVWRERMAKEREKFQQQLDASILEQNRLAELLAARERELNTTLQYHEKKHQMELEKVYHEFQLQLQEKDEQLRNLESVNLESKKSVMQAQHELSFAQQANMVSNQTAKNDVGILQKRLADTEDVLLVKEKALTQAASTINNLTLQANEFKRILEEKDAHIVDLEKHMEALNLAMKQVQFVQEQPKDAQAESTEAMIEGLAATADGRPFSSPQKSSNTALTIDPDADPSTISLISSPAPAMPSASRSSLAAARSLTLLPSEEHLRLFQSQLATFRGQIDALHARHEKAIRENEEKYTSQITHLNEKLLQSASWNVTLQAEANETARLREEVYSRQFESFQQTLLAQRTQFQKQHDEQIQEIEMLQHKLRTQESTYLSDVQASWKLEELSASRIREYEERITELQGLLHVVMSNASAAASTSTSDQAHVIQQFNKEKMNKSALNLSVAQIEGGDINTSIQQASSSTFLNATTANGSLNQLDSATVASLQLRLIQGQETIHQLSGQLLASKNATLRAQKQLGELLEQREKELKISVEMSEKKEIQLQTLQDRAAKFEKLQIEHTALNHTLALVTASNRELDQKLQNAHANEQRLSYLEQNQIQSQKQIFQSELEAIQNKLQSQNSTFHSLAALEKENGDLKSKLVRAQTVLKEIVRKHAAEISSIRVSTSMSPTEDEWAHLLREGNLEGFAEEHSRQVIVNQNLKSELKALSVKFDQARMEWINTLQSQLAEVENAKNYEIRRMEEVNQDLTEQHEILQNEYEELHHSHKRILKTYEKTLKEQNEANQGMADDDSPVSSHPNSPKKQKHNKRTTLSALDAEIQKLAAASASTGSNTSSKFLQHQVSLRTLELQQLNTLLTNQLEATTERNKILQTELDTMTNMSQNRSMKKLEHYINYTHELETQLDELKTSSRKDALHSANQLNKVQEESLLELHRVVEDMERKHEILVRDLRQQLQISTERAAAMEGKHKDRQKNENQLLQELLEARQKQIENLEDNVTKLETKIHDVTRTHQLEMRDLRANQSLNSEIVKNENINLQRKIDQLQRSHDAENKMDALQLEALEEDYKRQLKALQVSHQNKMNEASRVHVLELESIRLVLEEKEKLTSKISLSLLEKDAALTECNRKYEEEILPNLMEAHERHTNEFMTQIADLQAKIEQIQTEHTRESSEKRQAELEETEQLHSFIAEKHKAYLTLEAKWQQEQEAVKRVKRELQTYIEAHDKLKSKLDKLEGDSGSHKKSAFSELLAKSSPIKTARAEAEQIAPAAAATPTQQPSSSSSWNITELSSQQAASERTLSNLQTQVKFLESTVSTSQTNTHQLMLRVQELYDQVDRFCAREYPRGLAGNLAPSSAQEFNQQQAYASSPQSLLNLFLRVKTVDEKLVTHSSELTISQLSAQLTSEKLQRKQENDMFVKRMQLQQVLFKERLEKKEFEWKDKLAMVERDYQFLLHKAERASASSSVNLSEIESRLFRRSNSASTGSFSTTTPSPPASAMPPADDIFVQLHQIDHAKWPVLAAFCEDASLSSPKNSPTKITADDMSSEPAISGTSKSLLQHNLRSFIAQLSNEYSKLQTRSEEWRKGHEECYALCKELRLECENNKQQLDEYVDKFHALLAEQEMRVADFEREQAHWANKKRTWEESQQALQVQLQKRGDALCILHAHLSQIQHELLPTPVASSPIVVRDEKEKRSLITQLQSIQSYLKTLHTQIESQQSSSKSSVNLTSGSALNASTSSSSSSLHVNLTSLDAATAGLGDVMSKLSQIQQIASESGQHADVLDIVAQQQIQSPTEASQSPASASAMQNHSLISRLSTMLREQEKRYTALNVQFDLALKELGDLKLHQKSGASAAVVTPVVVATPPPAPAAIHPSSLGYLSPEEHESALKSLESHHEQAMKALEAQHEQDMKDWVLSHSDDLQTARDWRISETHYKDQIISLQAELDALRAVGTQRDTQSTAQVEALHESYQRQLAQVRAEMKEEVVHAQSFADERVKDALRSQQESYNLLTESEASVKRLQAYIDLTGEKLSHLQHQRDQAYEKQTALEVEINTKLLPRISELESLLNILEIPSRANQDKAFASAKSEQDKRAAVEAAEAAAAEREKHRADKEALARAVREKEDQIQRMQAERAAEVAEKQLAAQDPTASFIRSVAASSPAPATSAPAASPSSVPVTTAINLTVDAIPQKSPVAATNPLLAKEEAIIQRATDLYNSLQLNTNASSNQVMSTPISSPLQSVPTGSVSSSSHGMPPVQPLKLNPHVEMLLGRTVPLQSPQQLPSQQAQFMQYSTTAPPAVLQQQLQAQPQQFQQANLFTPSKPVVSTLSNLLSNPLSSPQSHQQPQQFQSTPSFARPAPLYVQVPPNTSSLISFSTPVTDRTMPQPQQFLPQQTHSPPSSSVRPAMFSTPLTASALRGSNVAQPQLQHVEAPLSVPVPQPMQPHHGHTQPAAGGAAIASSPLAATLLGQNFLRPPLTALVTAPSPAKGLSTPAANGNPARPRLAGPPESAASSARTPSASQRGLMRHQKHYM